MTCFIAVNGFSLQREFIFKEIAIISGDGESFHVWNLLPPCPFSHLNAADRVTVSHISNHVLNLKWEDGFVPYKYLCNIFEVIAREYKRWFVDDQKTQLIVNPFKSISVKLKITPSFREPTGSDDTLARDAWNLVEEDEDIRNCVYCHTNCAVRKAVLMYKHYQPSD